MAVSDYSTSSASNTTISGINIAENCPPSGINDAIRQGMADLRAVYNDLPWINYGSGSGSPSYTYLSATSFKITGTDVTSIYASGRRIRAIGPATGTIFGTIGNTSFGSDTNVSVIWDSGSLINEAFVISLGPLPQSYQASQIVPKGSISGLTMSAPGGGQILTVTSGQAADSTASILMNLGTSYTKTMAAWASGSGNGSLDGGSLAVNTWYHVFLIRRPDTGAVDLLTSSSPTSPALPTNYTQSRRIGAIKTDSSSNIVGFSQFDDKFYLSNISLSYNAIPGTTAAVNITVSTPLNIQCEAFLRVRLNASGSSAVAFVMTNMSENDQPAAPNVCTLVAAAGFSTAGEFITQTDKNSKIRARMNDTGATLIVNTYGWTDHRDK